MAEPHEEVITQVIAGILTGGAGAATSMLGVFRKTKARLNALEEALGKEEPVKTGLFLTIYALEETVKKIKREFESWEDDPPKWAERLLSRHRTTSSSDLSTQVQFEETITRNVRSFNERLSRVEDEQARKIQRLEQDVERARSMTPSGKNVTREEYLIDSRLRAEEMTKMREQIATVNGLLRGLGSALGIVDVKTQPTTGDTSEPPPPHAPRFPLQRPPSRGR
jgi:hypothetical protein